MPKTQDFQCQSTSGTCMKILIHLISENCKLIITKVKIIAMCLSSFIHSTINDIALFFSNNSFVRKV